jgi:hypothetical protein
MESIGRGVLGRPVEPGDDNFCWAALCVNFGDGGRVAKRYSAPPFKPSGRGIRMML